jgi:hypothetical protein
MKGEESAQRWRTPAWSGCQEEASGEEIELGAAEYLALEHLEAIDLAFDWALAPGQGHGGLDGGQVRPEPFGEASEGREGALGGTCQPWLQLGGLALADEGGEVLGERHGFRQLWRLRGQLRQLVTILRCRPLR